MKESIPHYLLNYVYFRGVAWGGKLRATKEHDLSIGHRNGAKASLQLTTKGNESLLQPT